MSPRTKEANEAIHAEKRMTILTAALGAFVERGYEGTRIQEIADRSGLSYGLVYRYFPNKEAVFTVLVDMALAGAGSLIGNLAKVPGPEFVGSFVGFALADPSPLYFALIVEALTKQSVPSGVAARARETVSALKTSIAAAGGYADRAEGEVWAEGILAILIGASLMKTCGISDGSFASLAATRLSLPSQEHRSVQQPGS